MTPFFGDIPFDVNDYNLSHSDEYCNPYELLDVSEWSPDIDGQIEELTARLAEQMEANGDMLADEDAESAHIGAPGEDLIGGLKDRKGCEGDCCDSEACSKEEEEEPPVDDEFASDDDGWAWK